jgi:sialidase-1
MLVVASGVLSLLALADLNGTAVFSNKLGGVANYRIPAVVQTAGSAAQPAAIVAFAEARDGGDSSASRIAVRSSTDAGASWSSVVFAAGSAVKSATCTKANITSCRSGNPAAVWDSATDEIVLLYVARGFGSGEDPVGNGMVKSSDGGRTWTPPIDVSDGFGAASGSMPGPGTALQLNSGPHKGRLLVASHHGAYQHDYVTMSDDNGASWKTIAQTFPKMDEAALTELPDGEVLLNMRHGDSPKQGRGEQGFCCNDWFALPSSHVRLDWFLAWSRDGT